MVTEMHEASKFPDRIQRVIAVKRIEKINTTIGFNRIAEMEAIVGGRLVARLGLTDVTGHPLCAAVRLPAMAWSAV